MSDATISIPFQGPDETVDPRLAPPGTLLSASNQSYDADGQLQVRFGYTALGSGLTSVLALTGLDTELDAIAGAYPTLYRWSANTSSWTQGDRVTPIGVTHAPIQNSSSSYTSYGSVVAAGYRVVAWVDGNSGYLYAATFDVETGAQIGFTTLSESSCANCFVGTLTASGTTYAIVTAAVLGASPEILGFVLELSPSLGNWTSGTKLNTSTFTSEVGTYAASFSQQANSGAGLVIVAWEDVNGVGSGTSSLQVYSYEPTGSGLTGSSSTFFDLSTGTTGFLTMCAYQGQNSTYTTIAFLCESTGYSGNEFVVAHVTNAVAAAAIFGAGSITTSGSSYDEYTIGIASYSTVDFIAIVSDGFTTYVVSWSESTFIRAVTVENCTCASAPLYLSGPNVAIAVLREVATLPDNSNAESVGVFGSYYLVDLGVASSPSQVLPWVLAVLAPSIVNASNAQTVGSVTERTLPSFTENANGNWEAVLPIIRSDELRIGLDLFTLTPSADWLSSSARLGRELYLPGFYYDRNRLVEIGFPQLPYASVTDTGTGYERQYCITWAYVDANGNLEESSPSPIKTVTGGATPNATITVRSCALTNKQRAELANATKLYAIVYRTEALATGNPILYQITPLPLPAANANNPSVQTFTISDTASDASITANNVLYTVSGELGHDTPETFTHLTVHMDRIWGIGADQKTIWYSQVYSDGDMPAWSDDSQMTIPDTDEPLIALASLYDRLLVFTETKIYVIYGQGPADDGTSNDLTQPQRVPSPCGCISPASVVNTPMGVMFQSLRGLELCGPDLSVQFIGLPVSTTTTTYPVCTSAVFVQSRSVVRFTMQNSAGSAGIVLNYDVRRGRWATHYVTPVGVSGSPAGAPSVAGTFSPLFGYVSAHNGASSSYIYRENTVSDAEPWLDFGADFIPLSVTTAWIKGADVQGWQRVRRIRALASYYAPHGLEMTLNYDYQAQNEQHSFSDEVVSSFVSGSWEQVRCIPAQGKCEAVQLTIATTAPISQGAGSGQGAGLVGLSFEVHAKKGGFRNFADAQKT